MKKYYEKPEAEVERYTLDMSIASNCTTVVSNGPAVAHHAQCEDYEDPFGEPEFFSVRSTRKPYNVNFYDDTTAVCDCYYSATDNGYWTS